MQDLTREFYNGGPEYVSMKYTAEFISTRDIGNQPVSYQTCCKMMMTALKMKPLGNKLKWLVIPICATGRTSLCKLLYKYLPRKFSIKNSLQAKRF